MKVYLETYGCQMNVSDSQKLLTLLAAAGYEAGEDPARADLIIINTCSVRDKPEQKVFSALGRYLPLKKRRPGLVVAVGGCVAQQWGAALQRRCPDLDLVFGTHAIDRVPALVVAVRETRQPAAVTDFREEIPSLDVVPAQPPGAVAAFVTIMQGCDNYCSYCIVPYVRGREYSRTSAAILAEIRALVSRGIKEVTLLGQNVNSYGRRPAGEIGFVELLRRVDGIAGLARLRFTTSHPKDLSPALAAAFGELEHLCPHIHLPLQAGSDAVLRRMGRGYTAAEYLEKVAALRRARPDIALSTDLIVGFPGEKEADFQRTMDLLEEVRYDTVYSFKYSPRPGTRAAALAGQVPDEVKKERLRRLQQRQDEITAANLRALEGSRQEVLVEGPAKKGAGRWVGRTPGNRIVNFSGPAGLLGSLVPVKITRALRHSLQGELD